MYMRLLFISALCNILCTLVTHTTAVTLTDTEVFAPCIGRSGTQQTAAVTCNGQAGGTATVLGVYRYNCGGANALSGSPCTTGVNFAYRLGLSVQYTLLGSAACQVQLLWSLIPSAANTAGLNCLSAVDCNGAAGSCTLVYTRNVTVSLDQPTWARGLTPTYSFPYTYAVLSRRKVALAPVGGYASVPAGLSGDALERARVLQSTLMLANDDGDDGNAYHCLNDTAFEQGIRLRGCCAAPDTKNGRFYDCTQDYNKCGCDQPRHQLKNSDGCATFYCVNSASSPSVSYLASAGSCWGVSSGTAANLQVGEFAAVSNAVDSSYSCCLNCDEGQTCNGNWPSSGTPCNVVRQRFVYPSLTAADFAQRYVDTWKTSGGQVAMSNKLVSNTSSIMNNNSTRVFPFALSGFDTSDDVVYYRELTTGTDVPTVRANGVWSTVGGMGTQPVGRINALVCSSCSTSSFSQQYVCNQVWGQPAGGGGGGYTYPTPNSVQPGVTATKNWLLGTSPTCTMYDVGSVSSSVYSNVNVTVNGVGEARATNVIIGGATRTTTTSTNGGAMVVLMTSLNQQQLPRDPYEQFVLNTADNAIGNMVICEAGVGLAQTQLQRFSTHNPWQGITSTGCDGCLPDELTRAYNSTAARVLFHWINSGIQLSYRGPQDRSVQLCNRNGFGDYLFTRAPASDDCDQPQLNAPLQVDNSRRDVPTDPSVYLGVPYTCRDDPAQLSCSCGGTNPGGRPSENNPDRVFSVAGKLQSYLCMQKPGLTTMCRPSVVEATIGGWYHKARRLRAAGTAPSDLQQLLSTISAGTLPPDWATKPNYWVGKSVAAQTTLSMYYQPGPVTLQSVSSGATQYFTVAGVDIVLADSKLIPIPATPAALLVATAYCPCQKVGVTASGTLYITLENTATTTTGYQFTASLAWGGSGVSCTFGTSNVITVRNNNQGTPEGSTAVPFRCTFTGAYDCGQFGSLTLTPVTSSNGEQLLQRRYAVMSCDCTATFAKAGDPTCFLSNSDARLNKFSTNVPQCRSSCGATAAPPAAPTFTATATIAANGIQPQPPLPPGATPALSVTPTLSPLPSGARAVPTATLTPAIGKGANTTGNNSATKDDVEDPETEDGWELGWIIGLSVGGVVLIGVALIAGVLIIYYCTREKTVDPAEKGKHKTE